MFELKLEIVPDEEDPGAFIFVDGSIGSRKYRFLLDTGAAMSEICFDSYTSTFNSIGSKKSSGAFSSDKLDLIKIPSISIGLIQKEEFILRRQSQDSKDQFNLIGMDLLKNFCCHFKFSENSMIVDPILDESYTLNPLVLGPKFYPYIKISFDHISVDVVWDTGASITVVDQQFIEENINLFEKVGESIGTDSTSNSQQTPNYIMRPYMIGTQLFPTTEVVGVDLTHINSSTEILMTMILGYTTIAKANWVFDFPNRCWCIAKMIE